MSKKDYQHLNYLSEKMIEYNPGSQGLMFLPFLVGSATPYYDPMARATGFGLRLNQEKSLMLHAVLEGISFNILENVNTLKDMGLNIEKVHIGAGGRHEQAWCQLTANVLGSDIVTLAKHAASSLGAAIIAGVGIGLFISIEEAVECMVKEEEQFSRTQTNSTN